MVRLQDLLARRTTTSDRVELLCELLIILTCNAAEDKRVQIN